MHLKGLNWIPIVGLLGVACAYGLRGNGMISGDAPAFSASGTDGKTHSVSSLTAKGPAVLYFIKEGCPVNHEAAPFLVKLSNAYDNKLNLIGVYNGDTAGAKAWAKQYNAKFTILADPDLKIIRAYKVLASPFLVEVTKDGKIGKLVGDGRPQNLTAANSLLATAAGLKVAKLDFAGSPSGSG